MKKTAIELEMEKIIRKLRDENIAMRRSLEMVKAIISKSPVAD